MDVKHEVAAFQVAVTTLKKEIAKVIIGHETVINDILISIFAGGHSILESVPGLGKTLLIKTLSNAMNLQFARIQFTPDLMPSDILGTNMIVEDEAGQRQFQFQKGPLFAQIILADEINRATPKTQSALLEAMQEQSVTIAGTRYPLEEPFFVLATQNPIEMEGTYPLPEAQLDRFLFKINIGYSNFQELCDIIDRTTNESKPEVKTIIEANAIQTYQRLARTVIASSSVTECAARLVMATHPNQQFSSPLAKKYIRYGASPRGAQAMMLGAKVHALLDGRYNVSEDDLCQTIRPALRHRIILNFEGQAEGISTDMILNEIIAQIK